MKSLSDSMASLEANLKKKENRTPEAAKKPSGRHSNGLGVKMSNALISATHSLNLNERRLIYLAMAKMKNGSQVQLNASEFAEAFGIATNTAYEALETACERLFEREIRFNDGRITARHRWVQGAEYHKGEGWCSVIFTDLVRVNIKGLQSQYTKYSLEQAGNLKSVYSWRFLERFIQYGDAKKKYKGWWELSIDELCDFLELSDYYREWRRMKDKIITPAIKELDEKDGWVVGVKPIKTGRKTTHVRFEFRQNPQGRLDI